MIRRILVALAGTPYTEASIQTATELAARHGAEVTGITVLDLAALTNVGPVPVGAGAAAKELRDYRVRVTRERVEQDLEDFSEACRQAGVRSSVLREERADAFDYVISQSRYHDVMVFGLKSIFEYDVSGGPIADPHTVLIRLIEAGVRPIVAVGEEYRPTRRVMIAYSGSVESAKTMKQFVQLRPWPDIEVCIAAFKRGQHLLDDAARYCHAHAVEAETLRFDLPAKDRLLAEAKAWGADLVVLGNSAKQLLLRRVLGETALRTIRDADRPLFLSQ